MPSHLRRIVALSGAVFLIVLCSEVAAAPTPRGAASPNQTSPSTMPGQVPLDADLAGLIHNLAPDDDGPPSVGLLVSVGERALRAGDLDVAEKAAQAALALETRNADAHILLGEVYWRHDWRQTALECYRAALAADPRAEVAQFRLVTGLAATGEARMADRLCRSYLAAGESALLWVAMGEVQEHQARHKEAFASYGRAQALDAELATAYSHRAGLLCRMGQYAAAQQMCHEALARDPEDALAHAYLALACAHRQEYIDAYTHAAKAERAGVDVAPVWQLLQGHE